MEKCISGCLGKDTKILLDDGSEKEISCIYLGDMILLSNNIYGYVRDIIKGYEETLLEITTTSGRIIQITKEHPVLVNNEWIKAGKLNVSDCLSVGDETEEIQNIVSVKYEDAVYNLAFEDDCSFYANGIVVGDWNMQCSIMFG